MALDISGVSGSGAMEALQKINAGQGGTPGGPAGAPGSEDVQRFQDALKGQAADGTIGVQSAGGPHGAAAAPAVDGTASMGMGDRILQGLSGASQKVQSGREVAMQALGGDNVSQADLLRANFAMIESSTLVTAVSKTTEKIVQGLKNLQQG